MNETKTMYHAVPAVSELNRVKGFDPTRYLRKTKDGPKLDLSIKKLWFRLKYPNGRIKLSALKITDQLAIIEARVYFDKGDANPVSSFTAQRNNETTPGGLYVEAAQHSAIDEALSAAGFGIQFIPANETRRPLISEDEASQMVTKPIVETSSDKVEAPITPKIEPIAEATPPSESIVTEVAAETPVVDTPVSAPIAETVIVTPAEETAVPNTVETTVQDEVTEIREEDTALPYTKDMSVEQICSLMSVDEAQNYIVPVGTCKGWTLAQVADRRPISLKWYLTAYNGDDNILKAAATIVQNLIDNKAA